MRAFIVLPNQSITYGKNVWRKFLVLSLTRPSLTFGTLHPDQSTLVADSVRLWYMRGQDKRVLY